MGPLVGGLLGCGGKSPNVEMLAGGRSERCRRSEARPEQRWERWREGRYGCEGTVRALGWEDFVVGGGLGRSGLYRQLNVQTTRRHCGPEYSLLGHCRASQRLNQEIHHLGAGGLARTGGPSYHRAQHHVSQCILETSKTNTQNDEVSARQAPGVVQMLGVFNSDSLGTLRFERVGR